MKSSKQLGIGIALLALAVALVFFVVFLPQQEQSMPANKQLTILRESEEGMPVPGIEGELPVAEYLILSGAINEKILVRESQMGALEYVNPELYKNESIIALFTSFYAGTGDTVAIRRIGDTLLIERQEHGEGEAGEYVCGPWTRVTAYSLPGETHIQLAPLAVGSAISAIPCQESAL